MASQAGPNPATPVSSVAASTTRAASSAAPAASSNAPAASSSAAPASSAASQSQSASSAAPSAVSSSAASSSAASSAPASSASSLAASSSAIASSRSSSASASRISGATIASAEASSTSTSSGLSGGAIGGIVGGVVGGIVLVGLLWLLLRRRKEKKNRVPPPPPRDFREMTFNGSSRPRMNSNNMMSASQRASSYSTLLQNGRPSSQYPSASRSPSYYQTYPVATPSTLPDSPPMPASISTESPTGSSGHGHGTPVMKPVLAPLNTGLRREGSDSSNDQEFGVLPKHKSSVDRLRYEGSERAPSPMSMNGEMSSRATSPHPSMYGVPSPSTFPRHSFNPDGGYPRPQSMTSISSRAQSQSGRYLQPHAPHGGRVIQPQMPKPLGARPDSSGDFFWATPKPPQGFDVGFDGGQNRRMSRAASELEMYQNGGSYQHERMPSSQSSKSTIAKPPRIHQTNSSESQRQAHHSKSMQSMRGAR